MAEVRLREELAESKAEVQRSRERSSTGMPTAHKELSLVSVIPKWSGADTGITLEEFSSIEGSSKIGRWECPDLLQVASLKLTEGEKLFYSTCPEIHSEKVTWETFKEVFRERNKDVRTDQFHFMTLQTARQGKN